MKSNNNNYNSQNINELLKCNNNNNQNDPLNFNNSQRFFTGYADENYIYIDRGIFSDIDELEQDTLWLTGKTAYITIRYTLKLYQSNFITKDNRIIITKEGNVFWSLNEDKTNLITK